MSSARSSARVGDEHRETLVRGSSSAVYGADGDHSTHHHHTAGDRPLPGSSNNQSPSSSAHQHPSTQTRPDSVRVRDQIAAAAPPPVSLAPSTSISGADGSNKRRRLGHHQLAGLKSSLSDRDLTILHSLRQLHLMSARQLERLHLPAEEFTPLSAARTMRGTLRRLHEVGVVDRLERRVGGLRAGSASFVYRLSPLGARLLDHPSRQRSREPSLLHLTHVLAVAELVVRLHEAAREDIDLELFDVQGEPECWRAVTAPHGGRVLLKPDLRVTLGAGERELHWFVEQDNASEHRPVLTRKCLAFLQAWRDGGEQASAGVFPRVLWVVPDEARVDVLRSVTEALIEAPTGLFVVATSDQAIPVLTGKQP